MRSVHEIKKYIFIYSWKLATSREVSTKKSLRKFQIGLKNLTRFGWIRLTEQKVNFSIYGHIHWENPYFLCRSFLNFWKFLFLLSLLTVSLLILFFLREYSNLTKIKYCDRKVFCNSCYVTFPKLEIVQKIQCMIGFIF